MQKYRGSGEDGVRMVTMVVTMMVIVMVVTMAVVTMAVVGARGGVPCRQLGCG